ncbi:hypothetical protein Acr_15g0005170 [Actinidia rufa]|uniref:Uncharacterized protein n=1 Tax=Actinidia rufa TaxID=165716 RepID=A0A7J0FVE7_9ERIC|nr:hypothetical protein Acr_15g0005170 [Actinidia rufa]
MKSGDPGMAVRKLRVEYGIKLDCTMMNAGPEEIVFFILVRLPADILYNSAQKKTNATVTKVSFPFQIEALATCDGLVLFRDRQNMDDLEFRDRRKRTIRVANPLIKKVATVPPLTVQGYHYYYFSLACTRSRREYKVVFAYGSNLRFEDFDWVSGRRFIELNGILKKRRSRQVFKGLLYRPPRPAVKTAFVPIAWVNNGEVVLFCVSCSPGPYIAYNVKTRETFTFGGQVYDEGWCFGRDFAYSLVWLTPSSLITRGGGGGGS